MKKASFLKFMSLWPPYFGSGIRMRHIATDFTAIDVELVLRFWNKNYVGTHYGGSLYSMTDPFFMLMLIENLGRDYIVWDKAATIRFKKPGRGTVRAEFRLSREQIETIKNHADQEYKVEPEFTVQVLDASGDVVAEVQKTLYVRRKDSKKPPIVS